MTRPGVLLAVLFLGLGLGLGAGAGCSGGSSLVNPIDASAGGRERAAVEASGADAPVANDDASTADATADGGTVDGEAIEAASRNDAAPGDAAATLDASTTADRVATMDAGATLDGHVGDAIASADVVASPEVIPADACGICDRNWLCNVADDYWTSQAGDCVDARTGTTLRCDGTIGGGAGTWAVTSTGLALYFNSLCGIHEIDCTPG
jgi:hypothetical protein